MNAPTATDALQRFHRSFAPFEYLSAIVAQEWRAGTKTQRDRRALERSALTAFARANRVVAPKGIWLARR